jgi:hypothetical protein
MAPHKMHRIKGLHAISILQDVALNGINVECQHAPEHALNHLREYLKNLSG